MAEQRCTVHGTGKQSRGMVSERKDQGPAVDTRWHLHDHPDTGRSVLYSSPGGSQAKEVDTVKLNYHNLSEPQFCHPQKGESSKSDFWK